MAFAPAPASKDARRLCLQIIFLPSRHRLYVRSNLAVADVLDRYAELTHIRRVDEVQRAQQPSCSEE